MNEQRIIAKLASRASLNEIVRELNQTGQFEAVVLTASEGLPIAVSAVNQNNDVTAAIAALLQRVTDDAQNQLKMGEMDEITLRNQEKKRLVCRYITIGTVQLILAVLVPSGLPYRRLTNKAIHQIEMLFA